MGTKLNRKLHLESYFGRQISHLQMLESLTSTYKVTKHESVNATKGSVLLTVHAFLLPHPELLFWHQVDAAGTLTKITGKVHHRHQTHRRDHKENCL